MCVAGLCGLGAMFVCASTCMCMLQSNLRAQSYVCVHAPQDSVAKKLRKYVEDPQYNPENVAKQSRAAMSLCMWTHAMDVYNRVAKVCCWVGRHMWVLPSNIAWEGT